MVRLRSNLGQRSRRLETWGVVACLVLGLAGIAAGVALRGNDRAGQPELLDWQLSALNDLNEDQRAIFSALSNTAIEIGYLNYSDGKWPSPDLLDEYAMPPFARDVFWRAHGSLTWDLLAAADITTGGATAYLGHSGTQEIQPSYLLVFQHRHIGSSYSNQAEVWMTPELSPPKPSGFTADALVRQGWKRVIAYSGADEADKIRG